MKISSYVCWLFALAAAAMAETTDPPMLFFGHAGKESEPTGEGTMELLQVLEDTKVAVFNSNTNATVQHHSLEALLNGAKNTLHAVMDGVTGATTSSRNVIIYLTFEDSDFVRSRIAEMHGAFKNNLVVIWDNAESPTCPFEDLKVEGLCIDKYQVSKSRRLSHMCCAQEKAFMWAIDNRQSFDHVWIMEDDVYATDISELEKVVNMDSPADLLYQGQIFPLDNQWAYAKEVLRDSKGLFGSEVKTGLLNLFRMSTAFLDALEDVYVILDEEWFFFEALLPSVADSDRYNLTHASWPEELEDTKSTYVFTVRPRCMTKFEGPGIYHPVRSLNGKFVRCPLEMPAPDIKKASPYKNQVSKLQLAPSIDVPLVHGCVGPLSGATNWHAIAGWVKYHQERWGLTHADIFVLDDQFHVAQESFDAAGLASTVALNFVPYSAANGEAWVASECRTNANEGKRDFLIEFEPDRFLVADKFESLQALFNHAAGSMESVQDTKYPDAVVFPTLTNHYDICNSNEITFASATFGLPDPDFAKVPSLCPNENPWCKMSDGVTRFFMIGDDQNAAHLIRFINGAEQGTGLHADLSTKTCLMVKECNFIGEDGECTDMEEISIFVQRVTSVNLILSDYALNSNPKEFTEEAMCYAKRYPNLMEGYCGGDITKCSTGALHDHYVNHGSVANLIWECDKEVSPATSVARRRLVTTQEQDDPLQVYILLFETDHERIPDIPLAKQATAAGISLSTFGAGIDFEGFGTKWGLALSALDDVPPDALVVISDGRDVILNIHGKDGDHGKSAIEGFVQAFRALTLDKPRAVVMSAEGQCCVSALTYAKPGAYFNADGTRAERACASGEEGCMWAGDALRLPWEHMMQELAKDAMEGHYVRDSYLNAGLVAGRAQDVKRIIELANMETFEDDQAVFTDVLFNRPDLLVLDYAQEMFGNMRWTDGMDGGGCNVGLDESNPLGGLVHVETKTVPLFLHTPGKFLDCLAHLADTLEIATIKPAQPERRRALQGGQSPCNYGQYCPPRPNECPLVQCDFSTLLPNVILGDTAQEARLVAACGLKVSAKQGATNLKVNVFDSTNIKSKYTKDDPDLGAPNKGCVGGGPGRGKGGKPGAPFPNCDPQGNLLIIQDPRKPTSKGANDSPYGGCITLEFQSPIDLINLGMIDLEEQATITMITADGDGIGPYTSNPYVGDNGFWPMDVSYNDISYYAVGVTKIKVCLAGGGGISYLNYHDCPPPPPPTPPPVPAPTACPIIDCDFSTLLVGVGLDDPDQAQRLSDACLMTVTASNTIRNNKINIFDSTIFRGTLAKYDPDLGAPNIACPSGGPGRGRGGKPTSPYPNCDPQGNLMIIQNENKPVSDPNDSAYGGCYNFVFSETVSLLDFALLDLDENTFATVTFNDNTTPDIESPLNVGDNGLWIASVTNDLTPYDTVNKMKVCVPGSGAVSYIKFKACDY